MTLLEATGLALPGRLRETALTLDGGTLTCLIGPNGSGKTSLLHAIAEIGRPKGRVRLGNADPWTAGPANRPHLIGFLPASRDVKWPLAARDLIALGGAPADEALAELDLLPLADTRVDRMSTGERSRVLLARVLAPRPALLLLDEPVANLDPLWQLKLMERLRAIVRDPSRAALVAMHDLDLARRYADRLIVMDGGMIVADGAPDTLLDGPEMRKVFGVERRAGVWRAAL